MRDNTHRDITLFMIVSFVLVVSGCGKDEPAQPVAKTQPPRKEHVAPTKHGAVKHASRDVPSKSRQGQSEISDGPSPAATPEKVFDSYRAAFVARDWKTALICSTPRSQLKMLADAVFQMQTMGFEYEKLDPLFKKYGVEFDKLADDGLDLEEIAAKAKNKGELYFEVMQWLEKQEFSLARHLAESWRAAKVRESEVGQKRATFTVDRQPFLPQKPETQVYVLKEETGKWFVDLAATEQATAKYQLDSVTVHPAHRTTLLVFEGETSGPPVCDMTALAFSPDGKLLATTARDRTLRLWTTENGESLHVLPDIGGVAEGLTFSPDGRSLAAAVYDPIAESPYLIKIWDVASKTEQRRFESEFHIMDIVWTPDGKSLVCLNKIDDGSVGGISIGIRNSETGEERQTIKVASGRIWAMALSSDGKIIAGAKFFSAIRLWKSTDGELLGSLEPDGLQSPLPQADDLAFSPNSQVLATGHSDGAVRLWDVRAQRGIAKLTGHKNEVKAVAFSPDGLLLASASKDWSVKLWDVAARKERDTYAGHKTEVFHVAFSPDGRILATGDGNGIVMLWNVPKRE